MAQEKTPQEISKKLTLPLSKTLSNLRLAFLEMHRNYWKKRKRLDEAGKAEFKRFYDVLHELLNNLTLLEKQIRNYKEVINDDVIAERHIAQLNIALKKACDTTWLYEVNEFVQEIPVVLELTLGLMLGLALCVAILPSFWVLSSAAGTVKMGWMLHTGGVLVDLVGYLHALSGTYLSLVVPISLYIALVAGLLLLAVLITRKLIEHQSKLTNPFNVNWQAFPELSKSTCFIDNELHINVRRWVGTPQETLVLPKKEELKTIISANYKPFFKDAETQDSEAADQPKPQFCLSKEDAGRLAGSTPMITPHKLVL